MIDRKRILLLQLSDFTDQSDSECVNLPHIVVLFFRSES